jgi:protein-disulfide isomerase
MPTVVPQLMTDYVDTNRIRYVYREVYFDRFGLWASMVARCGGPDRFFGIVDLIYEQQPSGPKALPCDIAENLRRIGRTAGLTNEDLDACLTNQPMAEALLADLRGEHGGP